MLDDIPEEVRYPSGPQNPTMVFVLLASKRNIPDFCACCGLLAVYPRSPSNLALPSRNGVAAYSWGEFWAILVVPRNVLETQH